MESKFKKVESKNILDSVVESICSVTNTGFIIIFGSYNSSDFYNDIDIAYYSNVDISSSEQLDIIGNLSKVLTIPFDLVCLNDTLNKKGHSLINYEISKGMIIYENCINVEETIKGIKEDYFSYEREYFKNRKEVRWFDTKYRQN